MFSARVVARAAGLRAASANVQISRPALGGLRTYAAAAAPDSRPPVALYGVDGTYANALVSGIISIPFQLWPFGV